MWHGGRIGGALVVALAGPALLTGCTGDIAPSVKSSDERIAVVASTDVWGSVVEAVGAGRVAVTSLINSPSRDPHEYQADARDQLSVLRAAIVVENGGGYDDFMRRLLTVAHPRTVVNATALSGDDPGRVGFNEHLWYDLPTVGKVADTVSGALQRTDPAHRTAYREALARFHADLHGLAATEGAVRRAAAGRGVAITEPVPVHLTTACGLLNRTPSAFSAAIEDGRDVAPGVLQAQLRLVRSDRVALLAVNEQTADPVTDLVVRTARAAHLPVVGFRESLPGGSTFLGMFHTELDAVRKAVTG